MLFVHKHGKSAEILLVFLVDLILVLTPEQPYSVVEYEKVTQMYGDAMAMMKKYDSIFVDSITVAGRLVLFQYCYGHPDNKSDRTGKIDTRAVYGMQGREMMSWLTHLQHIRDKNVIFVGILDEKGRWYGRTMYELQIEGSKTGRELPGIVDEVITMAVMPSEEHGYPYRAFVCQTLKPMGLSSQR